MNRPTLTPSDLIGADEIEMTEDRIIVRHWAVKYGKPWVKMSKAFAGDEASHKVLNDYLMIQDLEQTMA